MKDLGAYDVLMLREMVNAYQTIFQHARYLEDRLGVPIDPRMIEHAVMNSVDPKAAADYIIQQLEKGINMEYTHHVRVISLSACGALVRNLLDASAAFEVEPEPYDIWRVSVRDGGAAIARCFACSEETITDWLHQHDAHDAEDA